VPSISIIDLEVFYHVGITDEERAKPQKLLLTVDMEYDFSSAAVSGRIERTIDYFAVSQRLLALGEKRKWKLIETVATDIADKIIAEFRPENVTVEVKKFVIPEARYVSVSLTKERYKPQEVEKTWWLRRWY
jgi:FolB domain-containing protein